MLSGLSSGRVSHLPRARRRGLVNLLRRVPGVRGLRSKMRDEAAFLRHIVGHGLWRQILKRRLRRNLRQTQKPTCWQASLHEDMDPRLLAAEVRRHGIQFSEGSHTIYIHPQPSLRQMLGEFVSLYPEGAGFKLLKNPGRPDETNYVGRKRSYFWAGALAAGKLRDMVPVGNVLHQLGLGPQIYDLAELRVGQHRFSMLVVEHVPRVQPTLDDWRGFMSRLRMHIAQGDLLTTTPGWENNQDFAAPDCNQNLVKSAKNGRVYFVDTQNFVVPSYRAYVTRRLRQQTGDSARVNHGFARWLPESVAIRSWWTWVRSLLADHGIQLSGRLLLDFGCRTGTVLAEALSAGAFWAIGSDKTRFLASADIMLGALGYTRYTLLPGLNRLDSSLAEDIPHLAKLLPESIFVCRALRHHPGLAVVLKDLPWRALIFEGAPQPVRQLGSGLLDTFRSSPSTYGVFTHNNSAGLGQPIVVVLRYSPHHRPSAESLRQPADTADSFSIGI